MNRKQWRRVSEAQAKAEKANAKIEILRIIIGNDRWYEGQCSESVERQLRLAQVILEPETVHAPKK